MDAVYYDYVFFQVYVYSVLSTAIMNHAFYENTRFNMNYYSFFSIKFIKDWRNSSLITLEGYGERKVMGMHMNRIS